VMASIEHCLCAVLKSLNLAHKETNPLEYLHLR
jgi:hypothetical protein